MVKTVDIEGSIYDLETIQIAAEIYEQGELSGFNGAFESLNRWHDEEDLTSDTVAEYLGNLRSVTEDLGLKTTGLDDLASFADQSPEEAASAIKGLYEGDESLVDRIEQLRDVQSIGTTAVSCLLAAYDREVFAPFPDNAFTSLVEFTCDYHQPELEMYSVPEKYNLYNTTVCQLGEAIDDSSTSFSHAARMADLIAMVISDREQRQTVILQRLIVFSSELDELEDDVNRHLDTIASVPDPILERQANQYRDTLKINQIRYRILDQILDGQEVSVQDLEDIKIEVNEEYDTNITRNWRNFTILASLRYDLHKARFQSFFEELTEYLIVELDGVNLSTHIVDFQGMSNYPTKEPWFVLYPAASPGFKRSYQLFARILPGGVRYGITNGDEVDNEVRNTIETESPTITDLLQRFRTDLDQFEQLNADLDWHTEEEDEEDEFPSPEPKYREYARQLKRVGQLIFYGPPGTGKTFTAHKFSKWWLHDEDTSLSVENRLHLVTFHPSFTYEDFLEGLTVDVDEGSPVYDHDDGVFKAICDTARDHPDERFLLVIDEINRGNLAKIFGETITLLEYDKRGVEVDLAHSGDSFSIPPNVYLIGTMNTADRSIALVDAAIRRRFRFIPFPPDYDFLYEVFGFEGRTDAEDVIEEANDDEQVLQALSVLALQAINREIRSGGNLGKGKQVGHSYLLGDADIEAGEVPDAGTLVDAWRYDILPLLEEYYFGNLKQLQRDLFADVSTELFDWEREQIRPDIDADKLRDALGDLVAAAEAEP